MNITLIGMSGVGKSRIGEGLAKKLNYKFVDTDRIIEKETGLKLQKIINSLGDKKFLEIEEKTILNLKGINKTIISPGGSIVYSKKAMKFLSKISVIIYLKSDLKEIIKKIKDLDKRGIVGLKNKGFKNLFNERRPIYERYGEIKISIRKDQEVKEIVNKIISLIGKGKYQIL
ncbi:MAG TPA: shikimate kinase [Candidatus Nanoarchaeia archaeon]|nr:shikimate kinase [Candidatus Nanoarchaeia archaeon]